MAKGGGSKMLYFVLYVVLITELMIVITERDELEEKEHETRNRMLGSIAESYKKDVKLFPADKFKNFDPSAKENEGQKVTEAFTVYGLVSDEEKAATVFYVDAVGNKPPGWPSGGINSNDNTTGKYAVKNADGNGEFVLDFANEGDFKFRAWCEVERQFPKYLPSYLLDDLKKMVPNAGKQKSNDADFTISIKRGAGVKKKGVEFIN